MFDFLKSILWVAISKEVDTPVSDPAHGKDAASMPVIPVK